MSSSYFNHRQLFHGFEASEIINWRLGQYAYCVGIYNYKISFNLVSRGVSLVQFSIKRYNINSHYWSDEFLLQRIIALLSPSRIL